jgi:hypothetical protein
MALGSWLLAFGAHARPAERGLTNFLRAERAASWSFLILHLTACRLLLFIVPNKNLLIIALATSAVLRLRHVFSFTGFLSVTRIKTRYQHESVCEYPQIVPIRILFD